MNIAELPPELTDLPKWVLWRDEAGKKMPYSANTLSAASSTDRITWAHLPVVMARFDRAANGSRYSGVGFVFAADDPYCGIDLDGCRDPETGIIAPWAQAIIDDCQTYAEISPSKTGVKIFCRGKIPSAKGKKKPVDAPAVCSKAPGIELYDHSRYFTVTGDKLPGSPAECADCQDVIDALWVKYIMPPAPAKAPVRQLVTVPTNDNRLKRCRGCIATKPPAISEQDGHNTTFNVACEIFRFGLDDGDSWAVLQEYNARCLPPWEERDLMHKWESAKAEVMNSGEFGIRLLEDRQQNSGVELAAILNQPIAETPWIKPGEPYQAPAADVAEYGHQIKLANTIVEQVRAKLPAEDIAGLIANYSESRREFLHGEGPKTIEELMSKYQEQRAPIIHGLLREGETMNIIAAPKMGKSWLVYDLGLSVATGGKWLGEYQTVQGDVLLIDNELYPESLATRIPKVADALGLQTADYAKSFVVEPLRGRLKDIASLNGYFARFEPGRFKLVIIDAWYRALPKETDENANGDMTSLYNLIDCYSQRMGCAFVLIHHASKGNQSGKSVTDVGSGAGAQSRAADTHLVLRPHEENDVVVLDAAVRSWPSVQPTCLRWHFPAWELAPDLDPALLRKERPRRSADKNKDVAPKEPEWTPERFAGQFAGEAGQVKLAIIDAAIKAGLSDRKATDLFKRAVAIDLLHEHPGKQFSTVRYIATEGDSPAPQATFFKRDAVVAAIDANPEMSNREIAKLAGVDHSYVGRIRKELIK